MVVGGGAAFSGGGFRTSPANVHSMGIRQLLGREREIEGGRQRERDAEFS